MIKIKKKKALNGVSSTNASVKNNSTGEEKVLHDKVDEVGPPLVFDTEPALVSYHAQMTANLGDFESAKVGVSLTMPCNPSEVDEMYEYVRKWVDFRMQGVNKELENAKEGGL